MDDHASSVNIDFRLRDYQRHNIEPQKRSEV